MKKMQLINFNKGGLYASYWRFLADINANWVMANELNLVIWH